ncbi:MAG: type II toxin-antitoxin system RelE/ParE family toxin [Pirellulales bacterium]
MRFTVLLTARALRDLVDARDYIRQSAPQTAERWYFSFLEALLRLEQHPEAWPIAPESGEFPFELRQFLFRTRSRRANRALFVIAGTEILVLAIRRPGQPLITKEDIK